MSERHPLDHPFDAADLSRRKKSLKRELLAGGPFLDKKIAILGGSTTELSTQARIRRKDGWHLPVEIHRHSQIAGDDTILVITPSRQACIAVQKRMEDLLR